VSNFYFLNESMRSQRGPTGPLRESNDFPIKIRKDTWQHLENPRRISKIYSFDDKAQQRHFVSEVMAAVSIPDHAIKIVIESFDVMFETYTEGINDVTQFDLDIARRCDEIFQDSLYVLEPE
jgi:pterin-4a-carbinolamine dehydratase